MASRSKEEEESKRQKEEAEKVEAIIQRRLQEERGIII